MALVRWFLLLCCFAVGAQAGEADRLRLGLVKYGSGAWQIDTLRRQSLDVANGLSLEQVDLANPAAGEVAVQAGGVDAIVSDWLWVARQRAAGQKLVFLPHSSALGELLLPAGSTVNSLGDLAGKKLGVAGGPLDKSWLLLRAYGRRTLGYDLADKLTPVYGAPPLLSQELAAGRLDGVLTYWPFAARLAVQGNRSLLSMAEVMAGLGFAPPVPMMGFAVREDWIAAHPGALARFAAAQREADRVMLTSDGQWQTLRPLTAAEDDRVLAALRDRYRAGALPEGEADIAGQAAKLYRVLAEIGGLALTGGNETLPPGTFWAAP